LKFLLSCLSPSASSVPACLSGSARMLASACLAATLALNGCGSSGPVYPQNVSVTMSPVVTSLAVGNQQQFTATVTNYTATPSFFVSPTAAASVGTMTPSGLYTAPAVPPIVNYGGFTGVQGAVTVNASVDYPSPGTLLGAVASTTETFVITAPSVVVGFITNAATVPLGTTYKFQPYAVGSVNRGYTLQVNGVTGGSMATGTIVTDATNAGLYTAPTVMPMTGKTITITAISQADPTKTADATVTLQ
jgi:hypothetical protein